MAAPLPYLLIAVKAIDLQKVSVSDMQNLYTLSKSLSAYGKSSLFNRGNLTQRISMLLSRKKKPLLNFFLHF